MRKPRGFNHQYIYVDERKEKLAKMEEKESPLGLIEILPTLGPSGKQERLNC